MRTKVVYFVFKQKTAYEMRISDWSSDVCSSDLWRELAARNRTDDPDPVGERCRSERLEDRVDPSVALVTSQQISVQRFVLVRHRAPLQGNSGRRLPRRKTTRAGSAHHLRAVPAFMKDAQGPRTAIKLPIQPITPGIGEPKKQSTSRKKMLRAI